MFAGKSHKKKQEMSRIGYITLTHFLIKAVYVLFLLVFVYNLFKLLVVNVERSYMKLLYLVYLLNDVLRVFTTMCVFESIFVLDYTNNKVTKLNTFSKQGPA